MKLDIREDNKRKNQYFFNTTDKLKKIFNNKVSTAFNRGYTENTKLR